MLGTGYFIRVGEVAHSCSTVKLKLRVTRSPPQQASSNMLVLQPLLKRHLKVFEQHSEPTRVIRLHQQELIQTTCR